MKIRYGLTGMIIGIVSFTVAVLHLWLGPFEKVTIEDLAIQKAKKIKQIIINSLTDNDVTIKNDYKIGPDKIVHVVVIVTALAGLILGLTGFVKKEHFRYYATSIAVSGATIALQYLIAALGAIVIALIIMAVLSKLDFT